MSAAREVSAASVARLLLVGSIPLETPQSVFEQFGGSLGRYLGALPDGEVGLRLHWISRIHFQVFALHPDLEIMQRPPLENGVERLHPRNTGESWRFKLRDGVDRIRFGERGWRLGYARDAREGPVTDGASFPSLASLTEQCGPTSHPRESGTPARAP